jgi:hypothetical protein
LRTIALGVKVPSLRRAWMTALPEFFNVRHGDDIGAKGMEDLGCPCRRTLRRCGKTWYWLKI